MRPRKRRTRSRRWRPEGERPSPDLILIATLTPRRTANFFPHMSTLHESKTAAATLPAADRSELGTWLSELKDVWQIRREQLRREIQVRLDEIERGEVAPLDIAEIKREARARFEAGRGN